MPAAGVRLQGGKSGAKAGGSGGGGDAMEAKRAALRDKLASKFKQDLCACCCCCWGGACQQLWWYTHPLARLPPLLAMITPVLHLVLRSGEVLMNSQCSVRVKRAIQPGVRGTAS